MKHLLYLLFILSSMNALEVDIIANFNIGELPLELLPVKREFDVKTIDLSDYFRGRTPNDPNLHKIIIFNPYFGSFLKIS